MCQIDGIEQLLVNIFMFMNEVTKKVAMYKNGAEA